MNDQRILEQYTNTRVETSSPLEVVVMLYEGALRFINDAERAVQARDHQEKANQINRALRIVQELANALDHEASPDLSQRLAELYEYVSYELLQGSAFNDVKRLDNGRRVLERLLGSWQELSDAKVEAPRVEGEDSLPAPSPAPGADEESSPRLSFSA